MKTYVGNQIEKKLKPFYEKKVLILFDRKLIKEAKKIGDHFSNAVFLGLSVSEKIKDLTHANTIYTKMIRANFDRDSLLISIGGGAIGDLGGFVASTFLRGIGWINIPTTLVAQIDAAIGGKTGVNHPLGKNLIGTFYPPKLVLCNPSFLSTLSIRDRISGLGEMIKYGLTYDPNLYQSLEKYFDEYLNLNSKFLDKAIKKCVRLKEKVVSADLHDVSGLRQVLNFGHTFGHAIETVTDYKVYRHGEAVIQGMRIALILSVLQGHLKPDIQLRVDSFLSKIPMPRKNLPNANELIRLTKQDKKRKRGKIGFVLLDQLGSAIIDDEVSLPTMKKALGELQ